jgi:hypothetical protein
MHKSKQTHTDSDRLTHTLGVKQRADIHIDVQCQSQTDRDTGQTDNQGKIETVAGDGEGQPCTQSEVKTLIKAVDSKARNICTHHGTQTHWLLTALCNDRHSVHVLYVHRRTPPWTPFMYKLTYACIH